MDMSPLIQVLPSVFEVTLYITFTLSIVVVSMDESIPPCTPTDPYIKLSNVSTNKSHIVPTNNYHVVVATNSPAVATCI